MAWWGYLLVCVGLVITSPGDFGPCPGIDFLPGPGPAGRARDQCERIFYELCSLEWPSVMRKWRSKIL